MNINKFAEKYLDKYEYKYLGRESNKDDVNVLWNRVDGIIQKLDKIVGVNIDDFEELEQYKLLEKLISVLDSKDKILNIGEEYKKGQVTPNKLLFDNLSKENMDIDLDKLIFEFSNEIFRNEINEINYSEFEVNLIKEKMKDEIRCCDPIDLRLIIEQRAKATFSRAINYNLEEYYFDFVDGVYSIEELNIFLYMQILTYHIVNTDKVHKGEKIEALKSIEKYLDSCMNELKLINLREYDARKAFIFKLCTINRRNELKQYLNILRLLEKENKEILKDYDEDIEKYDANQRLVSDFNNKNLMEILYEGKVKNKDDFNNKLENTEKFIDILVNKLGRRFNSNYLQHFKGVFREIYIYKSKFNNKIAKTVVEDIFNNGAESISKSDRFFIGEKISRGMYREKKLLELYCCKNSVQEKLYRLVLKTYDQYHPYGVMIDLDRILSDLLENLIDIAEKLDNQKVQN